MTKQTILAMALTAVCSAPPLANAAQDPALEAIRAEIRQLKETYEARIQSLEQGLKDAESRMASAPQPALAAPASGTASAAANAFNPAVSLILGGTYANLSRDPAQYRIQGFMPGGESIGPGKRSFTLGESELTFSANVDPHFSGRLTFSLTPDNQASVEEAVFETQGLAKGINLKGGRFLSAIGYLNSQHAHAWDFVDAPLAYQALFGGQYKQDGLQLRWLAPSERFIELGVEAGDGAAFPGNDRSKNGVGSTALFAHVGDDIGDSASWRGGLSYLQTGATKRDYTDLDHSGTAVSNGYTGHSKIWLADGIYKWAPNGNATHTSIKLQGEYFQRKEYGTLSYDTLAQSLGSAALPYASAQSGWYFQGVYQFMPSWRVGLRYDQLHSGAAALGLAGSALRASDFPQLGPYQPTRTSLMFDYSPSEFSRLRLQLAQDKSRPEATDHQFFLQYIMSLGVHGAHSF